MTGDTPSAECSLFGATATETFGNGYLCADCVPSGELSPVEAGSRQENQGFGRGVLTDGWASADFSSAESDVWPPELLEREQWMGHVEKKPFTPWVGVLLMFGQMGEELLLASDRMRPAKLEETGTLGVTRS